MAASGDWFAGLRGSTYGTSIAAPATRVGVRYCDKVVAALVHLGLGRLVCGERAARGSRGERGGVKRERGELLSERTARWLRRPAQEAGPVNSPRRHGGTENYGRDATEHHAQHERSSPKRAPKELGELLARVRVRPARAGLGDAGAVPPKAHLALTRSDGGSGA